MNSEYGVYQLPFNALFLIIRSIRNLQIKNGVTLVKLHPVQLEFISFCIYKYEIWYYNGY